MGQGLAVHRDTHHLPFRAPQAWGYSDLAWPQWLRDNTSRRVRASRLHLRACNAFETRFGDFATDRGDESGAEQVARGFPCDQADAQLHGVSG